MTLYGSLTSPYVRRVRVLALERGLPLDLCDSSTPEGQAQLAQVTPILKVPVLQWQGQVVFDSGVIQDLLWGPPLRPLPEDPAARARELNLINATDEALDALIRRFYLRNDTEALKAAYLDKDHRRAALCLAWVASQLQGPWCTSEQAFGRGELALVTALGWMRYRGTFPIDEHPALSQFEAFHADRPSLRETRPPGA